MAAHHAAREARANRAKAAAAAAVGRAAEQIALRFLAAQGLELLQRNFRRRVGELDLIARKGDELIVAEVRTRSSDAYGGGAASVDWRKRQRIVRTTSLLLQKHHELAKLRVRFDVLVISNMQGASPHVEWIRHAF